MGKFFGRGGKPSKDGRAKTQSDAEVPAAEGVDIATRFRKAAGNAEFGTVEWDLSNDKVKWSDSFYHILGLEPQSVPANQAALEKIIHPDDLDRVLALSRTAQTGQEFDGLQEYRIVRPNGEIRHLETRSGFTHDKAGQVDGIFGIVVDVTERKEAEAAAILNEERLADAVEAGLDFIWETDPNDKLVYVSDKLGKITGTDPNAVLGMTPWEAAGSGEGATGWEEVKAQLSERKAYRGLRTCMQYPDGRLIHWSNAARPRFSEDGAFLGFRGASRNISDQVAAERREHYQAYAMEYMSDGVIMVDADNSWTDINDSMCDILGANREDLLGRKGAGDIWNAINLQGYDLDDMRASWEKGSRYQTVIEFDSFDGRHVIGNIDVFPLLVKGEEWDGGPVGRVVIFHDETALRTAQQQLVDSEDSLVEAQQIARFGSWDWTLATEEFVCTPELLRIYGMPPEPTRLPISDIVTRVHPDDLPHLQDVMQSQAASKMDRFEVEYRIRHHDGTYRWVRVNSRTVEYDNGQPTIVRGTVQDIDGEKRAANLLEYSQKKFRAAMDGSLEAIFYTDAKRNEDGEVVDFIFTDVNAAAEAFTGLPREKLLGQGMVEVFPDNMETGVFDRFVEVLEAGEPKEEEYRNKVRGVAARWIHHLIIPYGDQLTFHTRDVTLRREAEENMLRSEQRFRDVADISSDFIWETNTNDELTFLSGRHSELTMQEDTSVLGRTPWDVSSEGGEAEGVEEIKAYFARREPYADLRTSVTYPEGHTMYWANSGKPIFDEDGTFLGYRGAARDVTENRQRQDALEHSEARVKAVMDNAAIGIATIDETGIVQSFNREAEHIFGFTSDEVLGRNISMLMTGEDKLNHDNYLRRYIETGEGAFMGAKNRAVTGRRKSGETFPLELSIATMESDEGQTFIGSFADVSEKRETERRFQQAQKMEAVGQLTGGVAHDFNNLLGSMLLNLDFLRDEVNGSADGERMLNTLTSAVERGASLTQRLLAFSRQQVLDAHVFDANTLIHEMESLLRSTLPATIRIDMNLQSSQAMVNVDQHQLESALLNLAINARDAMEDGGVLSFKTSTVKLAAEDLKEADNAVPGTYICLAVADTGEGIPEHLLDHVLEPFFTTKETGKGTGLGLSMVYGFVQQSEGHFVLSSQQGGGTTVSMYFPMVGATDSQQDSEVDEDSAMAAAGELEHILVVEDNPEIERVISRALSKIGYNVHSVKNGPEAVTYLENSPRQLDLLLTDMVLPDGLSGLDIARKLRQLRPDTKIIFMTGYSDVSTHDDDEAIRDAPLLNKPFKLGQLTSAIRTELG